MYWRVEGQDTATLLDRDVGPGRRYTYYMVARLADGQESSRHPGRAEYALGSGWVSSGNLAPVAAAGPNQTVDVGVRVTLDGSGSSDPDGDALSSATAVRPTFTATAQGTYRFALVVNDGRSDSRLSEMEVVVVPFGP